MTSRNSESPSKSPSQKANLEDLIRRSARQGNLNYISLSPDSDNPKQWRAVYRDVTGFEKHHEACDVDPVEAIKRAISKKNVTKHVKRVAIDDDII